VVAAFAATVEVTVAEKEDETGLQEREGVVVAVGGCAGFLWWSCICGAV